MDKGQEEYGIPVTVFKKITLKKPLFKKEVKIIMDKTQARKKIEVGG